MVFARFVRIGIVLPATLMDTFLGHGLGVPLYSPPFSFFFFPVSACEYKGRINRVDRN